MKNKDKRGLQLLQTVTEYIIAAIVLVALISLIPTIYNLIIGTSDDAIRAKNWINSLVDDLNALEQGEIDIFVLLGPKNWVLIYFDQDLTHKHAERPPACFDKNCLCICKKRLFGGFDCSFSACRTLLKKVEIEDGIEARVNLKLISGDILKISISELGIAPAKLTDSMKLKLQKCDVAFDGKHKESIGKASGEYKIQESKIKAIACQESGGDGTLASCAGAVGVMQLMPPTARGQGLNVPYYETEDISQIGACKNDKGHYTKVSVCNKIHPENCDYENDERFNSEKNIIKGTAHLAYLETQYDTFDQVLAAYNWGGGNLNKKCPDLNLKTCELLPEETAEYIPIVLAYYGHFEAA